MPEEVPVKRRLAMNIPMLTAAVCRIMPTMATAQAAVKVRFRDSLSAAYPPRRVPTHCPAL